MDMMEIKTPAALVDLERLERNAAGMARRMTRLGVHLRPHIKTHKCVEAARVQVRGHGGGITVSTLAEARQFARHGFDDITWALPLPTDCLAEAAELNASLRHFGLLVEHRDTLKAVLEFARGTGARFELFLEVDCGDHRTGLDPEGDGLLELAQTIHAVPEVELRGILTHAGHAYAARGPDEIRTVARQERDVMVGVAARLARAGAPVATVSVGSTPTMSLVQDLSGITEARPGNYLFLDAFQAAIGSCTLEDVAFSVLATVVSVHPERSTMVVNAGALALSKDEGPRNVDPNCGFGVVCTPRDTRPLKHLELFSLSQEHGQIRCPQPLDRHLFHVGSRLRIIPNHSCLAAAGHDRYHVLRGNEVVDIWRTVRGW